MKKATITSLLLTLAITQASAFSLGDAASAVATTTAKESSATQASSNALVGLLSSQLGITDQQATGGVGSILNYAQGSLSSKDYNTLASAIGDADKFQAAAPKTDKGSNISALAGAFGKSGSSLGSMAGLVSQFSSLGLDGDMISKFIPIIMNYLQGSGSTDAMGILSSLFSK